MAKVANYDKLERIGNELYERSVALEMFCAYAKPAEWWDWMTQELQKAPSRRVA